MNTAPPDKLAEYLDDLQREECYRVQCVIKETEYETTQEVYFVGANGAEQGPFIRKYISTEVGLGQAYERIYALQQAGKRFSYLPRIFACYLMGAQRVVIMEYVQGETLQDVVYRCDPSLSLAADVFPRLCDAVGELHRAFNPPLIHRDLKPSNVMLSGESLTIIDFGIARSFKEGEECDTTHFGTRAFAPPEQFGFGQTDERSDVYALGMLLYFCLTEKIADQKVRVKGFSATAVPLALRSLLKKATQFDPKDRYSSAEELKQAFLSAMNELQPHKPLSAVTPPPENNAVVLGVVEQGLADSALSVLPREEMIKGEPKKAFPSHLPTSSAVFSGLVDSTGEKGEYASTVAKEPWSSLTPGKKVYKVFESLINWKKYLPVPISIGWNILVVAVFLLFLAVCVDLAVDPRPDFIAMPFERRILLYGSVSLFILGSGFYLAFDRNFLKRRFPRYGQVSFWKELLGALAVCLLGFLLAVLAVL